jgi:hypothetical protein
MQLLGQVCDLKKFSTILKWLYFTGTCGKFPLIRPA